MQSRSNPRCCPSCPQATSVIRWRRPSALQSRSSQSTTYSLRSQPKRNGGCATKGCCQRSARRLHKPANEGRTRSVVKRLRRKLGDYTKSLRFLGMQPRIRS